MEVWCAKIETKLNKVQTEETLYTIERGGTMAHYCTHLLHSSIAGPVIQENVCKLSADAGIY
jgi:hypothetical protein